MSLKLCPFCGGRGHLAYDEYIQPACTWIFCVKCRAKTRPFSEDEYEDPKQAAIDAWNARTGRKRGSMLYEIGMYGGKFLPPHIGHAMCIAVCCAECREPHIIMFANGADEERIRPSEDLSPDRRFARLSAYVRTRYPHAQLHLIDISDMRNPDGTEDWDAETPLVREILPRIDAIYSSEPSYSPYFQRAYPEAIHRLLDPGRTVIPISGTAIRAMDPSEAERWTI